jgi:hypothetical protein
MTPQQEQDYKRLQWLESTLSKDPAHRRELNKLLKKADPTIRIPELDAEEAIQSTIDSKLKAHEEEVKALQKRLIERDAQDAVERQEAKLRRAPYNLTRDDIDEVKKIVSEKNKDGELISLETAAQFYIARRTPIGSSRPVATPFSTRGQRPKNDFRKELRNPKSRLFTDRANYMNEQFDEAWNESLEVINSQNQ